MIEPFYGAMDSPSTQGQIQTQIVQRMKRLFTEFANVDKPPIKSVIANYIFLPGSMPQMVLTRAKQISKGKADNIQLFVLFYLLKKYLYWGAASSRLGFSANPRLAQFKKDDKPTADQYMDEFNTNIKNVERKNITNLMKSTAAVGRMLAKPIDKLSSLQSEIGQESNQDQKRAQSRKESREAQRRIDNENTLREWGNTPKSLVRRKPLTDEEKKEAEKKRLSFQPRTRKQPRYSEVPVPRPPSGGKRTRKRRLPKRIKTRRRTRKH
jgi:hypothetical protein